MQFRVIIPPTVSPGQMIRIRCPDGTEGDVRVPAGLKAGDSFIFEMPDGGGASENRPGTGKEGAGGGGTPGGGGGSSSGGTRKRSGKKSKPRDADKALAPAAPAPRGAVDVSGTYKSFGGSFLDREIVDRADFLMALGVGMLIGLSIVAGFLVGVLLATDP